MKKIENWLILPVLILLFYGASKYSDTSIDIHLHDTYYIISSAAVAGWFAGWLLIVFVLFKLMRRRNKVISIKFPITYIVCTLLLFCIVLLARQSGMDQAHGFSDVQLSRWIFYDKLRVLSAACFLLVQVIFLIYFVVQLIKKPIINRQ